MPLSDEEEKWADQLADNPPKIVPSAYALEHGGVEPYQEANKWQPWGLHTIPNDDWYDRAKR